MTANKTLISIRANAARVVKQANDLLDRRRARLNADRLDLIPCVEQEANTALASFASDAIIKRLAQKLGEKRYGWYNPDVCTLEELRIMLEQSLCKGQFLDAAIFCLFIYTRQQEERV
ncbi:hypothetical protein VPEG_00008 [Vibrio phage SIO-2]|uniref:hypothetical protein n=1 Tax=Vibrio phage SIO-2 TaxID=700512 RepID=UPI0002357C2E|nr:hypothetical protein VPEG_00008 [Vibrio phage SIO-2]AET42159.1 hypothetical protein VPEG_00008 [Vibrio phage SIO-2]